MKDLKHLVIKPIVYCALSCSYCEARQEHFDLTKECILGVDDWVKVFKDADDLGVEYLDISGGEPSLYKYLDVLVWEGKNKGWFVSVNSSGTGINKNLIKKLEDVCLDQIIISIMSLDEEKHDLLRGTKGSFRAVRHAIELIKNSSIRLVLHFIVSKNNFEELPEIINKSIEWGASSLALIYPENDFSTRSLLLSENDILTINKMTKEKAIYNYRIKFPKREKDINNIENLYPLEKKNFSNGIFWDSLEEVQNKCDKPSQFVLIYTNGDVLPCNAVEYTKSPIMGNVLNHSLKEIWENDKFNSFRKEKMNFCLMCPVKRHTGISIAREDNPPYTAKIIKKIPKRLPIYRPYVDDKFLNSKISNKVYKTFSNTKLALEKNITIKYKVYLVTEWWFPKIGGLEKSIEYLSNALLGKINFEILTLYNADNIVDSYYVHRFINYEEISKYIINNMTSKTIIHIFGFSYMFYKQQANFIHTMKDVGCKIMLKIPTSMDVTKKLKNDEFNLKDKIDYYLSLNDCITDELIQIGVGKNNIVSISNTVPTELFTPLKNNNLIKIRNKYNLNLNKPILCFSGRFVRRKRLDLIIDAIKRIHIKQQPILLLIGEVDNTFDDAFDLNNKKQDFIYVLPFQTDLTLIYKCIDAYISASELEGMSNSCLEAMSSGVPLIVSDIAGQKELVGVNEEGGWIFKKGDVNDLKLTIESFYEEWQSNTIYKKKNWVRKTAIKKYDSRLWAQRYEILYNSLIVEDMRIENEKLYNKK